jgi:hypothetical protein
VFTKIHHYTPTGAISVKNMTAFWDTASCSLVEVDRRFRGTYCLHHYPDDEGSTHHFNVSLLVQNYMAPYPRKLSFSTYNNVLRHSQSITGSTLSFK